MIVNKQARRGLIEIDLAGPEGNAHWLLGYADRLARLLGRDPAPITERMRAGDYENLVAVFDAEFGDFVTLLR